MSIEQIQQLVEVELQAMDHLISEETNTQTALISKLSKHLICAGGKKLRPLTLLLGAKCFNYDGKQAIQLAAVVEFIHSSSLLHDDVVDNSKYRRGKETAHQIWGNKASVLVGDYLFSKAFQLLLEVKNNTIFTILANTFNRLTQGEIKQLVNSYNENMSESLYMEVIHYKTSVLFESAAQMGAILAGRSDSEIKAMACFGQHMGTAFQMIDDVLDYQASSDVLGKNIGNDLAEGKVTLPLIHTLENGSAHQKKMIKKASMVKMVLFLTSSNN